MTFADLALIAAGWLFRSSLIRLMDKDPKADVFSSAICLVGAIGWLCWGLSR